MGVKVREKVKGSGEWWLFINHDGRRTSKKVGRDKGLADEAAEKINARLVLGDFRIEQPRSSIPTLAECREMWLESPHGLGVSTLTTYNGVYDRHIKAKLGKCRIDRIQKRELKLFLDRLQGKGYSDSSVSNVRSALAGPLGYACSLDIIERNPPDDLKSGTKGKKKQRAFNIKPLTEEEAEAMLQEAEEHLDGFYYPILLCALRTGMRIGELRALRWSSVNFKDRYIQVERRYCQGLFDLPKNGRIRRVDMSLKLAEVLKALHLARKKQAFKEGREISELVFISRRGNLICDQTVRRGLWKCLENVGLHKIRIHDLRHSYATIRLMKGHNILDVSYQLGHSNIKITQDVYCHWIPGKFKNEVDELDTAHPMRTLEIGRLQMSNNFTPLWP